MTVCSDLYVDSIAMKIRTKATIQTSNVSQTNVIINGVKKSHLLLPNYSRTFLGAKMVRKITSMLRICVRHFYTSSALQSTFFKRFSFNTACLKEQFFSIFLLKNNSV